MARLYRQDGGWAWMVLISCFLGHIIFIGMSFSFGVYFVIFRDHFGSTASLTSWVGSLNTGLLFGAGPIASILLNLLGCRPTIIIGGFLAAAGFVASYFATDIYHLIITFGLTSGLGFGICYTPCVVMVSSYFNRWRYLATALACSGGGLGCILFAIIFNKCSEAYSWQGSMLINGGIALNLVLCGVIMKPLPAAAKTKMKVCDVSLFYDAKMFMFAFSMLCWNIGSISVYVIIADYLMESGVLLDKAVYIYTIIGIANTIGRPAAGLTALFPQFHYGNHWVYTVSIGIYGVATLLFNLDSTYGIYALFAAIFGFFFGSQLGAIANIIIDLFGMDKFNNSYGYLMFAQGVGNVIGPPVAGALRDMTQDYMVSFVFAGCASLLGAAVLVVIYFVDKSQRRFEVHHPVPGDEPMEKQHELQEMAPMATAEI